MIKSKFNNSISFLKNAIDNDKLVVFAGAGISKDSGIPLWNELINEIKSQLDGEISESDYLKIAQILYNEKGEKEYNDIIKKFLFKNKTIYNPLHEIIFELNPQHIITTNYDNFFEEIIENKGLPFSIVSKDIDLPYAEHKNLLIKYHGDFDNKNIIFKETDYLEFTKNNTLKEIFVKSLFSNKVVLFVGYSVGDINLKLLIRDVQFILNKHHQRAYLLTHKKDISNSEAKYFENLGINIINFCDQSLHDLIDNDKLSTVGKLVYKQLTHLKNFDLFEYKKSINNVSSQSKIIDDLYTSLYRFYYFRVLPKNLLASLYPLNKNSKNDAIYNVESDTLITYNDELHNLIKDYKGENDDSLSDEDKNKLNFAISRMIHSGFNHLGKKIGAEDMLGNRATSDKIDLSKKYYSKDKNCQCIDCTIGRLEYDKVILKIEKTEITEDSELWDDLVYAHSLYRIGEFYKSYLSYEKIEIKANKIKQMDVSFVCKYNLKRIGINISGLTLFDTRYQYDDIKIIENRSKEIDLDKELIKIKYFVDKDVYNFLREIRDGIYVQRLCNDIDNFYNKIPNDLKIIKKGGSVNNSDYNNLYFSVRKLNNFLQTNFIIENGFSTVQYAISKSIKTFILGFYVGTLKLNSNQNRFGISKLNSFNEFLFKLIIDYADPKELASFIKEKEISNIKFDKESQASVTVLITSFFKSSYEINKVFNGKNANDLYKNYLNYTNEFKNIIVKQFKNICIVLTYFEFTEQQLKIIISDLTRFISFFEFKKREELFYLSNLFEKKYNEIGYDLLLEAFNIFNTRKNYNYNFITLLVKLKKLNPDFLIEKMDFEKLDIDKVNYELFTIYNSLNTANKILLQNKIEDELFQHNDTSIYYLAILDNIPIKKESKERYIKLIHNHLESEINIEKKDYANNYIFNPIIQYFELINSGILKDKKIFSLNIQCEIFKFIINPEIYSPDKFEVEWLKIFRWNSYIERFSKIDYIHKKLEEYLFKNEDTELSKIFFKLLEKSKS